MQKLTLSVGIAVMVLAGLGSWAAVSGRAGGATPEKGPAKAQEQLLYSFTSSSGEDHMPLAGLVRDGAGNLYGTTEMGGGGAAGNVFELSPQSGGGWTEAVLHSFIFNSGDGNHPYGSLIIDRAGNLYGTTLGGGASGGGTVFEISPQSGGGWTETILHSFVGYPKDGSAPEANLIFDGVGNLYGTTEGGGRSGYGTVFELSPQAGGGWSETLLYSFQHNGLDGENPHSGLIFDSAGNLYGTTLGGGTGACSSNDGCGTVFELSPQTGGAWVETVLHSFKNDGRDGEAPLAGLIFDPAGDLYGTTFWGGSNTCGSVGCGAVFEMKPKAGGGWTERVLYSFKGFSDGQAPEAG